MSQTVIRVENLYKEYKLGVISHGTLTHDLQSWWARMRGKEDPNSLISVHHSADAEKDSFLALKDVTFEIKQGDRVGIVGKNGAGKSTLLKVLSKITSPTSGQVKIKGRIAALLEVGTGFHAELTGRENIYLNGAILGMNKKEIDQKLDEIIDFAGVEKHIDTPVKRYSSGMNVRLGFAIAAHLDPEILIVDEVLAVGDAEFQKKALGKMENVSKTDGRTILFVSHNMASVSKLCTSGVLLSNGIVEYIGKIEDCVDRYLNHDYQDDNLTNTIYEHDIRKRIQLHAARVVDNNGVEKFVFSCDESVNIEMNINVTSFESGDYGYLSIYKKDGTIILVSDSNDIYRDSLKKLKLGRNKVYLTLPPRTLGHGEYRVLLSITDSNGGSGQLDLCERICSFKLSDTSTVRADTRGGYLSTLLEWKIEP
ncbi:MAG: ABC transporter [Spirochaetae bacterium HGW-Spirochaetae-5]|nr:MAG: ABC transporter [Spirochaetae bacterium HGW-Spirochaetae-5]